MDVNNLMIDVGQAQIKKIPEPIYFSVTSDGTTGEEWITRLENTGRRVSDYAKELLRSVDFKPTNQVTVKVAVLKGVIFEYTDRITEKIRAKADYLGLIKPSPEVACLICEMFTGKEIRAMGLSWLVIMHEPIKNSYVDSSLLRVHRLLDDSDWLDTYYGSHDYQWNGFEGFVFVVL